VLKRDPLMVNSPLSGMIGRSSRPFVIAEMSGNHNQSLERALAIVGAVARSGAHALKIQTYTPDTMTIDINEREFHISDANSLWAGRSLYDLYGEANTPWDWHRPIFERANSDSSRSAHRSMTRP
jgi:sialic acid synthase SpsE